MSSVPPEMGSSPSSPGGRPATREQGAPDISRIERHPRGLADWLIAVAIFLALLTVMSAGRSARTALCAPSLSRRSPARLIFGEGMLALALVLTVWVMDAYRKRSWADYGLPGKSAFGKRFWQGVPYGFAMLSVLMGLMAASRAFSFGGWALTGGEAVRYGLLYLAGFILVAFFEEFSFRGYMQATLASGNRILAGGGRAGHGVRRFAFGKHRRG